MGLWLVINCGEKWLKNDRPVYIGLSDGTQFCKHQLTGIFVPRLDQIKIEMAEDRKQYWAKLWL